jgi:ketosteroid isomerase-like protein
MSRENVEIARRAYEAFNRHDFDAALEALDPDVEWHQITQFPDRAVYRGREDMRNRFWNQQLVEQFGDVRIDVEEFVDAGDHVVMIGHVVGHGSGSGLEFRLRVVNVLEIRDGKCIRAYDVAGPTLDAT